MVKAKGITPEPSACWEQFIQQVRDSTNLLVCYLGLQRFHPNWGQGQSIAQPSKRSNPFPDTRVRFSWIIFLRTLALTSRASMGIFSPALVSCAMALHVQIKENLHVILCFSPMAPEFRNRARKFPALVSCTVIDWFQPWPKEALASVGTRFLAKSIYLEGEGVRTGVEQFMMNSFEGVNAMCTKVR